MNVYQKYAELVKAFNAKVEQRCGGALSVPLSKDATARLDLNGVGISSLRGGGGVSLRVHEAQKLRDSLNLWFGKGEGTIQQPAANTGVVSDAYDANAPKETPHAPGT